ncbi:chromate efflux transporter [Sphingomonas arenae]|uniref:chromate efflux transporter n=1 Tax=Sphingomonas arenae TaxID=2812555 RepID=UPI0019679001|nr:chromate efflux transporter [Sphingomonas arenae]
MTGAPPTLLSLFGRFLRFGLLAWGGPVAQIAMIKRELVEEERWLDPQRFNRLLAVYQALPGPEAHELCVHLGMMQRGRIGGLLAGLGFMLPGLLLMLLLAWAYQRLNLQAEPWPALLLGVQVAVLAVIVRAVHRIGEHVLTDAWLWAVALVAAGGSVLGAPFWVVLPAGGLAYVAARRGWRVAAVLLLALAVAASAIGGGSAVAAVMASGAPASAWLLFLVGLQAGLLTFGGAYTAIPFVRDAAVGRGWVSDGQFLDGLALSGLIPAPLVIFATFVGYQAGGLAGALAITAGVFVPAFGMTLLFFDRLERVVEDTRLHDVLAGVAAGVVGLVAATFVELARTTARTAEPLWAAVAIFGAALVVLYLWRSKFNVLAVLPGAAVAGWWLFGG